MGTRDWRGQPSSKLGVPRLRGPALLWRPAGSEAGRLRQRGGLGASAIEKRAAESPGMAAGERGTRAGEVALQGRLGGPTTTGERILLRGAPL